MTPDDGASLLHLRSESAEVIVDLVGAPAIRYWGAPLGDIGPAALRAAIERPIVHGSQDVLAPIALVPEHGSGFTGQPGLAGHRRRGDHWSPRFQTVAATVHDGGRAVTITADDPVAELTMTVDLALADALSVRVQLTNTGTTRFLVDRLTLALPLPEHARELLRFDGRWSREFQPVREPIRSGMYVQENRTGRPSQETPPLLFVGEPGFGEWHGEVFGVHLAWSGAHQAAVQVLADGRALMSAGELLHPGEISLEPGERYTTPELIAVHSASGLTPASWAFHRTLRARPGHPTSPRPVLLNTWEAVYFDHDLARLRALADAAAEVGIERFVLDDGWFGSRRDDTSGLGDWVVSADAWPDGLAPLIDHVRGLGMEFGIWVEPEMVNPDSDLHRAHPDWVLAAAGYEPVLARNQLVLDLARPDAYAHVRGQLDVLLRDHDIAFVKWDMNRNHVQASGATGAPGTHAQTVALYRLLDDLRARHPGVEFESCASGGGRIDAGILARTERVWTSDCIDPLERQTIQRGVSMFLPPELMGAHIGAPTAHTTGRTHGLAMRAITALFGHLGVEWNLLDLDAAARADLRAVIDLHRRFRPLLHGGDTVRFDPLASGPDVTMFAHGVYATDRSEALVAAVQLRTGISLVPPMLRLPGLDPDRRYRIDVIRMPGRGHSPARRQPGWLRDGLELTGRQLARLGIQLPALSPETAVLLHLTSPGSP